MSAFANEGYVLSPDASVTAVEQGSQWSLTQNPVNQTIALPEPVGYLLEVNSGSLTAYCNMLSLNEQSGGDTVINLVFPTGATALDTSQIDATTRCPNYRTLTANQAAGLDWDAMITVPRPPLAVV